MMNMFSFGSVLGNDDSGDDCDDSLQLTVWWRILLRCFSVRAFLWLIYKWRSATQQE